MVYMLQGVERMLKTIAEKAADKLVLSGDKRQVAYVRYGLEVMMMTSLGICGMILISIILHMKWAWIPFLISFSLLRSCAGGYHAHSAIGCFVISESAFLCSVLFAKLWSITTVIYWMGYLIAWIIILKYAPVQAVNHKLTDTAYRKNRIRSMKVLVLDGGVLWLTQGYCFGTLYYLAMMCSVISMMVAIQIDKLGGEVDAGKTDKVVSGVCGSGNIDCN